jgi:hypothetical protein
MVDENNAFTVDNLFYSRVDFEGYVYLISNTYVDGASFFSQTASFSKEPLLTGTARKTGNPTDLTGAKFATETQII